MGTKIPVAEIFGPTLQGEGSLAGVRTMFIRTAYCDGAGPGGWCDWCDSMFAVNPKYKDQWTLMEPVQIAAKLASKCWYCKNVTISGGNPAIHDLSELLRILRKWDYHTNIETQGTIYREWLRKAEHVTVSPKPPSAGSVCNLDKLQDFMANFAHRNITLKVVVDPIHPDDYKFAKEVLNHYKFVPNRYISIITTSTDDSKDLLERWKLLTDKVLQDPEMADIAVLPQLHVLLWGHKRAV